MAVHTDQAMCSVSDPRRVKTEEFADVAELADALDSGSSGGDFVKVQVLSSAPKKNSTYRVLFFFGMDITKRT